MSCPPRHLHLVPRTWPVDVPAPSHAPRGEVEQRGALALPATDWESPAFLRSMLLEAREHARAAEAGLLTALVAIRWLVARQPEQPSSPGAERLVIRAVVNKATGRGAFRGITVDSFTCPRRRALWLYLTARVVLRAAERPAAWELQDELDVCEGAGEPTPEEVRAAVAELLADQARRDAIHAARSAARALEQRLDPTATEEIEKAVKALARLP